MLYLFMRSLLWALLIFLIARHKRRKSLSYSSGQKMHKFILQQCRVFLVPFSKISVFFLLFFFQVPCRIYATMKISYLIHSLFTTFLNNFVLMYVLTVDKLSVNLLKTNLFNYYKKQTQQNTIHSLSCAM